jgi:hypothetical protein
MSTEAEIASEAVRQAVRIAVDAGNSLKIVSVEWKPKQVAFMDRAINSATKSKILAAFPDLEYFASEATPHNPATEGFIDRTNDIAIAFPARGEHRRWY